MVDETVRADAELQDVVRTVILGAFTAGNVLLIGGDTDNERFLGGGGSRVVVGFGDMFDPLADSEVAAGDDGEDAVVLDVDGVAVVMVVRVFERFLDHFNSDFHFLVFERERERERGEGGGCYFLLPKA